MKYARLLPGLLLVAACRSNAPAPAPFEILVQGYQSGEHSAGAQLVTDAAQWHAFWQRHASWRMPPAPEPAVDFSRNSVIVVRAGDQPTAGYVLQTLAVSRQGEQILVDAQLELPARGALVPEVVTQPFQILLVPRTRGTIVVKVDQRRSNR